MSDPQKPKPAAKKHMTLTEFADQSPNTLSAITGSLINFNITTPADRLVTGDSPVTPTPSPGRRRRHAEKNRAAAHKTPVPASAATAARAAAVAAEEEDPEPDLDTFESSMTFSSPPVTPMRKYAVCASSDPAPPTEEEVASAGLETVPHKPYFDHKLAPAAAVGDETNFESPECIDASTARNVLPLADELDGSVSPCKSVPVPGAIPTWNSPPRREYTASDLLCAQTPLDARPRPRPRPAVRFVPNARTALAEMLPDLKKLILAADEAEAEDEVWSGGGGSDGMNNEVNKILAANVELALQMDEDECGFDWKEAYKIVAAVLLRHAQKLAGGDGSDESDGKEEEGDENWERVEGSSGGGDDGGDEDGVFVRDKDDRAKDDGA